MFKVGDRIKVIKWNSDPGLLNKTGTIIRINLRVISLNLDHDLSKIFVCDGGCIELEQSNGPQARALGTFNASCNHEWVERELFMSTELRCLKCTEWRKK